MIIELIFQKRSQNTRATKSVMPDLFRHLIRCGKKCPGTKAGTTVYFLRGLLVILFAALAAPAKGRAVVMAVGSARGK